MQLLEGVMLKGEESHILSLLSLFKSFDRFCAAVMDQHPTMRHIPEAPCEELKCLRPRKGIRVTTSGISMYSNQ